jgi:hypothetical protein
MCGTVAIMLATAFAILSVVVLLGSALALLHLRANGAARPPLPLGLLHGLLAIVGLSCLVLALRGPPRGLDQGMASFGLIAAALLTLAALVGAGLFASRVRKKAAAGAMIGIHATLAVSGFVILVAYVFAG